MAKLSHKISEPIELKSLLSHSISEPVELKFLLFFFVFRAMADPTKKEWTDVNEWSSLVWGSIQTVS